jgi:undecaprenyl-diphosphatase
VELWKAALLGLVQGLTEFLPISSDGHLVALERWLGARQVGSGASFEAFLHVGTLFTCLVAFRADLVAMARVLLEPRRLLRPKPDDELGCDARFVFLGTLATVVTALPFADWLESLYDVKWVVVGSMVATGVLLIASRFLLATPERRAAWWQPLVVGALQTLAILPGLSRSCTTVVAGLAVGLGAPRVARLSFLLSVPIVAAATARQFWKYRPGLDQMAPIAVGIAVAFVVGLFAVRSMLRLVPRGRMPWFAPWMFALAIVVAKTWQQG